ncbi:hypothetical protein LCGC14_2870530 [marine sediment metagenome]|uniref:Uncharacterized protein n=1 Tax=marine sediment metagenome TaxID=412755 RepID=A0A0F8Y2W8_9ZZZZ
MPTTEEATNLATALNLWQGILDKMAEKGMEHGPIIAALCVDGLEVIRRAKGQEYAEVVLDLINEEAHALWNKNDDR